MSWPGEPDVVVAIREALERSEVVASVVLGGSRARGTATGLSDWDLYLEGESADLMAEIPALVAALQPLAAFWEPLSGAKAGYMIVMDGPVKVDLFPIRGSRQIQPPWAPGGDTLAAIDAHFWDWALWLGSKSLRGERHVAREPRCTGSCSDPSASPPVRGASTRPSPHTAERGLKRPKPSALSLTRSSDDRSRRRCVATAYSQQSQVRYREPAPCGLSAKPTQPPRIALPASSPGTVPKTRRVGTCV